MQAKIGGSFYSEQGSHYKILLHWNFIISLTWYVKDFIGYLFLLYYCFLTCFVSVEIGKAKSAI